MFTIYEDSYHGSDEDYHYVVFGFKGNEYTALIECDPEGDFFCLSRIINESKKEIWNLMVRDAFEEDDIEMFEYEFKEIIQATLMETFEGFEKIKVDTLETSSNGVKKAVIKVVVEGMKFWLHYKKEVGQKWQYEGGLGTFAPNIKETIIEEALVFCLEDLEQFDTIV